MSSMASSPALLAVIDKEIESGKWMLDSPVKIHDHGNIMIYVVSLGDNGTIVVGDMATNSMYDIPIKVKEVLYIPVKPEVNPFAKLIYKLIAPERLKEQMIPVVHELYQQYMFMYPVCPGMEVNFMWKSEDENVKRTTIRMFVVFDKE